MRYIFPLIEFKLTDGRHTSTLPASRIESIAVAIEPDDDTTVERDDPDVFQKLCEIIHRMGESQRRTAERIDSILSHRSLADRLRAANNNTRHENTP